MYKGKNEKGEIEIRKEKILLDNDFFKVSNDEVKFPGEIDGTYLRIDSNFDGSVAILPILENGDILLVKIFRHGNRKWGLELPKGAIEKNELPMDAAKRELLEETNLSFKRLVSFGDFYELPAIYSGSIFCFFAYGCTLSEENGKLDPGEPIAGTCILEKTHNFKIPKKEKGFYQYKDLLTEYLISEYKSTLK